MIYNKLNSLMSALRGWTMELLPKFFFSGKIKFLIILIIGLSRMLFQFEALSLALEMQWRHFDKMQLSCLM